VKPCSSKNYSKSVSPFSVSLQKNTLTWDKKTQSPSFGGWKNILLSTGTYAQNNVFNTTITYHLYLPYITNCLGVGERLWLLHTTQCHTINKCLLSCGNHNGLHYVSRPYICLPRTGSWLKTKKKYLKKHRKTKICLSAPKAGVIRCQFSAHMSVLWLVLCSAVDGQQWVNIFTFSTSK